MIVIDKQKLIRGLRDLSDERFQWDAWVHGKPGVLSSFTELVCQVFDDTGVSRALDRNVLEAEVGAAAVKTLRALSLKIDKISDDLSASELVLSPHMREVRKLASRALHQITEVSANQRVHRT